MTSPLSQEKVKSETELILKLCEKVSSSKINFSKVTQTYIQHFKFHSQMDLFTSRLSNPPLVSALCRP